MAGIFFFSTLLVLAALWAAWEYAFRRRNKVAQWLVLLFAGLAVITSGQLELGLWEKIAVNVWAVLVTGLPIYWTVKFIVRSWRS
jgi:hypothetical protein